MNIDIDNLVEDLINQEAEYYEYMGENFHKISNVDELHDRMLSVTIENSDGDIVTIEDLNDDDYEVFKKEINSLTQKDIDNINNSIIEDLTWKDEIPTFAQRNSLNW